MIRPRPEGRAGERMNWTKRAWERSRAALALTLLLCGWTLRGWPETPPTTRGTPAAELREEYDVVIAGAGTGGIGAAVQAARLGAAVLLLEETDWIGGQMTAAAVTSMDEGPSHPERGVLVRERGIYREFTSSVIAYYRQRGISAETAYWHARVCMEPRVGQSLLYTMLTQARDRTPALHVSLRSKVVRVFKTGDTVTGVAVEIATSNGKLTRQIQSRVLIDATEWGDVIPLTGARYRVGNCTGDAAVPGRAIQDITWTAVIKQYPKGVPAELLMTRPPPGYDQAHPGFARSLVAGEKVDTQAKPWSFATFIGYRGMPNSEQPRGKGITRTHLNYNNDYPAHVGDVENPASRIETGRQAMLKTLQLLYYIQHTVGKNDWSVADDEGFDSPCHRAQIDQWIRDEPALEPFRPILNHFSTIAYARESRRIIGLHTLVAREIERKPRSPRMFENTVALGDYAVDLHGSKRPDLLELELDRLEDIPQNTFGERGVGPFAIPFQCLIPEKLDGFLAAEKNISQSRLANGATRLQPSTMLIGQAAGAMAALSIQYGVQPRGLDPVLVQRLLLDAGDTLQITPLKDVAKSGWEWPAIQLVTVRGLMELEDGRFHPEAPLDRNALIKMLHGLFGGGMAEKAPAPPAPLSRRALAGLLRPAMAAAGVNLTAADLAQPDTAVTRLEAACVVSDFLEKRAKVRMTGREQTLPWPAPRAATPIDPADLSSGQGLAADIRMLVEHKVVDSADYWLRHAVPDATCDGERVAALLKQSAKAIQPASDDTHLWEVCVEAGLLNSPDYWKKNAVEGGKCSGLFVAAVIRRVARQLALTDPEPPSGAEGAVSDR